MHKTIGRILFGLAMTILLTVAGKAGAGTYTWKGPVNGNWTNAANWDPTGFTNGVGDMCYFTNGAQAVIDNAAGQPTRTNRATLYLNTGATLSSGAAGYGSLLFPDLHINGGTLVLRGPSLTVGGSIAVETNSSLVASNGTMTINSVLSGGSDLVITNASSAAGLITVNVASPTYSGKWILVGTGLGGGFQFQQNAGFGSGGLCVTNCPVASWIVNNSTPMVLDMRGYPFDIGWVQGPYTYNGTISLQSDGFFRTRSTTGASTPIPINLNGKISGPAAKLTLGVFTIATSGMIVLRTNNTYTGGTIITNSFFATSTVAYAQAAYPGCLGTGNLQVTPGATLLISNAFTNANANVMNPSASLYLDVNGIYTGRLNLAVSTTTTVAHAYVGGMGGWSNTPSYTKLAPGTYTATNLANYLSGGGLLRVPPSPGLCLIIK